MYSITTPFPVDAYAQARVDVATQFRRSVPAAYAAMYENFWCLGRSEVTIVEMQAILDRLGPVALQILQDAGSYVSGINTSFPGELDAKYHGAPYTYTVEVVGGVPTRIVLGALKPEWAPPPEEPIADGPTPAV